MLSLVDLTMSLAINKSLRLVVNEVQLIALVPIGDRWVSIKYYYVQYSVFHYYHTLSIRLS